MSSSGNVASTSLRNVPPVQRIDRYSIRHVLGRGAMSAVYAAWDPKLHREVALKVLSQRLGTDPKARERFLREARAIASLRHPNIVELYDYSGADSQHLYLVIEKLEGQDLFNLYTRRGALPETIALALAHELCSALQIAHSAGIVHRDLKPENVFLDSSGRVVLTDFGIVKAVREDSALGAFRDTTEVIGTPGFMAPEVMAGRAPAISTDIFSLGVFLYNIATTRLPFEALTPVETYRAALAGRYNDARLYNSALSAEFCEIIGRCLLANPKHRPQSVTVIGQTLKAILKRRGVSDLRDDLREYYLDPAGYAQRVANAAGGKPLAPVKTLPSGGVTPSKPAKNRSLHFWRRVESTLIWSAVVVAVLVVCGFGTVLFHLATDGK